MPTHVEENYSRGFLAIREEVHQDGVRRGLSAMEAGQAAIDAAHAALLPYYATSHSSYEGRSYSHWEVGEVRDGSKVPLFILRGETRTAEAIEIAFQLKQAREAGAQEARQKMRQALNLD